MLTNKKLSETALKDIDQTHPDLLSRAAAFLLLKDSNESKKNRGIRAKVF
jgi:hypothetical protein